MNAEYQLDRLLSQKFQNPYDVLLINSEATEEETRKQYKMVKYSALPHLLMLLLFKLSILVHPDKCKDPRAPDAFHGISRSSFAILLINTFSRGTGL